jgi:hypothetical protein
MCLDIALNLEIPRVPIPAAGLWSPEIILAPFPFILGNPGLLYTDKIKFSQVTSTFETSASY